MKLQICTKCGEEKPLSEFYKEKLGKYGRRTDCKKCSIKRGKKSPSQSKDKVKKRNKNYYLKHKEKLLKNKKIYHKIYWKKNKDKLNKKKQQYRKKNKLRLNKKQSIYQKNRRQTDINYKIRCNLSTRLYLSVKNNYKSIHTLELLGCSIDFLKKYLESQFKEGMSWNNYGFYGWHIDHIKPCASFDLTDINQQKDCFHYTNLQPLWAKDNLTKNDKYAL
jgi:hypothetical protein